MTRSDIQTIKDEVIVDSSSDPSQNSIRPLLPDLAFMQAVGVRHENSQKRISIPDPELAKDGMTVIGLEPGINILVGPNGSGKSTFLDSFSENSPRNIVLTSPEKMGVRYFTPPKELFTGVTAGHFLEGSMMDAQLANMFQSHGEGAKNTIIQLIEKVTKQVMGDSIKGGLLVGLDEPEGFGLDVTNLVPVIEAIKIAASKGIQFAIASHHPFFLLDKSFNFVTFGNDANYLERTREVWKERFANFA